SKQFQQAKRTRARALVYAYRDRRNRKREMRALWIARINAACRAEDITYNKFMHGLKKAKISLDRKSLAELAVTDNAAFKKLIEIARG
ncbi:MAG: 50S ribosomal protein L20, partial [Candidatus Omnitrophica bacterium]|nr:50S ribosomal protein L20 [Candidatus Omnitrophota bacterium]